MNFYVQIIDENGIPMRLMGPGTYEQCEEKGKELINSELQTFANRDMTEAELNVWEMDGSFSFEDVGVGAGGIYIVCSEEFT